MLAADRGQGNVVQVLEILLWLYLIITLLEIRLIIDTVRTSNICSAILLNRLSLYGLLTVITLKTADLTLSKLTGFSAMFLNL